MTFPLVVFLAALYAVIGAGLGLHVWLVDRANLDVVQDRGRALRRTFLCVSLVVMWPGALIIYALYRTRYGYEVIRRFVFGEHLEKESMRT